MENESVKNIINTIKKEHITPKSIHHIRWKSYVFWLIWGCITLIGAMSFSLMIINLLDIRPTFFHYLGVGRYMRVIFITAPYFWLSLAAVALFSGIFAMRRTYRGYRYSMLFITSVSVLAIMIIGSVVHFAKVNDRIGRGLMGSGMSRTMVFPGEERFQRPDHGMLGGRVIDTSEGLFVITDFDNKEWSVLYDVHTRIDVSHPVDVGSLIGVVGNEVDEQTFHADVIKILPERMLQPMQGDHMMRGGGHRPGEGYRQHINDQENHMQLFD